jgi:hypothetical protein
MSGGTPDTKLLIEKLKLQLLSLAITLADRRINNLQQDFQSLVWYDSIEGHQLVVIEHCFFCLSFLVWLGLVQAQHAAPFSFHLSKCQAFLSLGFPVPILCNPAKYL